MPDDINAVARFAYDGGTHPLDHALMLIETQIETRDLIRTARVHTPSAYPIFKLSLDDKATACRILGQLLDAGWMPPATGETE